MGGGTFVRQRAGPTAQGLSPRGRGNQRPENLESFPHRSIPAWAGEPGTRLLVATQEEVYPRVGGGTRTNGTGGPAGVGLSPRGRGEPSKCRCLPCVLPVYPRVGGGTVVQTTYPNTHGGLSPRGRGNRRPGARTERYIRSIPAWAGEPPMTHSHNPEMRVYPRVGGGTTADTEDAESIQGLSPRGRGNPDCTPVNLVPERSIPAWAGEPCPKCATAVAKEVYPRVGGGTSLAMGRGWLTRGLSPRGRGNRILLGIQHEG